MKHLFKTTLILLLIINFTACKDSFSKAETEALSNITKDIVEDAKKEDEKPKKQMAKYAKPFCDMLTEAHINEVFPGLTVFSATKTKHQKKPECVYDFMYNNTRMGIILSGQSPREKNPRIFLEGELKSPNPPIKIDDLGDEAYLFAHKFTPFIIVMKDGLRYQLQLNSQAENNGQEAQKLMRSVMQNID